VRQLHVTTAERGHRSQRANGGREVNPHARWHRAKGNGIIQTSEQIKGKRNERRNMNMNGARRLAPVTPEVKDDG